MVQASPLPVAGAGFFAGRPRKQGIPMKKHYLLASDFDQTLSFNDSGIVLSELLDISGFLEKVVALSRLNLVQQGAELAYLLAHDPEYRRGQGGGVPEGGAGGGAPRGARPPAPRG